MKEQSHRAVRDHMLDYVIDLLDNVNDFSWGLAKASCAVLLCLMEKFEVSDFSQVEIMISSDNLMF